MTKQQLIEEIQRSRESHYEESMKASKAGKLDCAHSAWGRGVGMAIACDIIEKSHLPIIDWRDASKEKPGDSVVVLAANGGDLWTARWDGVSWIEDCDCDLRLVPTHWAPITPDLLPSTKP